MSEGKLDRRQKQAEFGHGSQPGADDYSAIILSFAVLYIGHWAPKVNSNMHSNAHVPQRRHAHSSDLVHRSADPSMRIF